jgi:hypothetical protein
VRRFDVYGFRSPDLESAAATVAAALGVRMELRDSMYRGLYYRPATGDPYALCLESNAPGARWHARYPGYGATLSVNDLPDMDAVRLRLTAGGDGPVYLHSTLLPDELPDEDEG